MNAIFQQKIQAMKQGGAALAKIKRQLQAFTKIGTKFEEIEARAQSLIAQAGMKPSFSTVPGYDYATCIMKNQALCHGLPRSQQVADGDLISIDVGLINNGYHLDTSISFGVGQVSKSIDKILQVGRETLARAIAKAKSGSTVYDISSEIERNLHRHNLGAVYQLTGHGVGEQLHQEPSIPCVADRQDRRIKLYPGQTLAIEVMCTLGQPDLVLASDGWTYTTIDGQLSAMFEDTILVTEQQPIILTD